MINEPDIVKQLREEERIGKLQYNDFDIKERFFEIIDIKQKNFQRASSDLKITGYNDALKLAKKVLEDLSKN